MKAIVLAGGKGRRLGSYTRIIPKPLMPIGDMPVLEVLLRQMKSAGINDVVLAVGYLAELMRSYFQDGSRFGLNITYSYEETPLGTAGPLSLINDLNETFLVTNGDVLTTMPIADLIAFHHANHATATIAMHQRAVDIDLGVIECNNDNRVTGYIEKPKYDYLVSMGMYVFDPSVLKYIPHNQYLDFPDLVHILLKAGEPVLGFPFSGYWQDLGRPDDYQHATAEFEKMRDQFLPEIK
jgi:NDP-sugar pyrophosphorylase family protein